MILAQQNLHFLDQGRALVGDLTDELFTRGDAHGHASARAHLRHVLDCYRCFLRGLDSGRVDYDARERDPRLETERSVAASVIAEIDAGLRRLEPADRERALRVRVDAAAWGSRDTWTASSVGRELQFLLSHTVHHYAIIAMTLRSLGYDPGRRFGVAPSTLEHQDSSASSSSAGVSPSEQEPAGSSVGASIEGSALAATPGAR